MNNKVKTQQQIQMDIVLMRQKQQKKPAAPTQPTKDDVIELPDFNDSGIYIEDDTEQVPAQPTKKKKDEKELYDLEDEYYELDGF